MFTTTKYINQLEQGALKHEVFGTAAAAAAALEQCIALFSRFRRAALRQKGLPELIEKYSAEVSQAQKIVHLAASEAALKTPNVGATIAKLAAVGETLCSHLAELASARGPIRDFVKQLLSGERDQEKLESIMGDLGNAKQDLGMYIQLANVGLTRAVDETVQVNTAAVDAMNKLLHEKLGSVYTLRITQLIEGRPRNADGTVTLTEDDIVSLSKQVAAPTFKEANTPDGMMSQTARIVRDNEASEFALQVNTPIGVDVWKGMGSVAIERNKAAGYASQWNYPIASVDTFLTALEMRKGLSDPNS